MAKEAELFLAYVNAFKASSTKENYTSMLYFAANDRSCKTTQTGEILWSYTRRKEGSGCEKKIREYVFLLP